jgi:NADPH2:quinone reductase
MSIVAATAHGRAVFADAYGPPETYVLRDVATNGPGQGEIRVAVRARSVSFVDLLIASGRYQIKPSLPYIPGTEFSGVIDAVGQGVRGDRVGARVLAGTLGGGFADFAVLPERAVTEIPDSMPFDIAAIFGVCYMTAYHALVQRASLAQREFVFVLGAGGAVGTAAIQVAAALGARVIASTGSDHKALAARASGAFAVLDVRAPRFREELRDLTGGAGVDIVVDPVGGYQSETAFRALNWRGRHLVIGYSSGEIPRLATNLALLKGAAIVGVDLRQFAQREPDVAAENLQRLFSLYESNLLRPRISTRLPLAAYREGCAIVQRSANVGRVVLTDSSGALDSKECPE